MKIILPFILSLGLLACRQPVVVQAPLTIQVDGVPAQEPEPRDEYIPSAHWTVRAIVPEQYTTEEYFSEMKSYKDGAVYKYGAMTAIFSTEGRQIRLDCSTGGTATFLCLSDGGTLTVTCERMGFKVSCELK